MVCSEKFSCVYVRACFFPSNFAFSENRFAVNSRPCYLLPGAFVLAAAFWLLWVGSARNELYKTCRQFCLLRFLVVRSRRVFLFFDYFFTIAVAFLRALFSLKRFWLFPDSWG